MNTRARWKDLSLVHSNAIEHHKPDRFRLNRDELVALIAIALLGIGMVFGAMHPQPPPQSCYQPAKP